MQRRDQRAANANYYRRNRDREIARVRRRQDATRDALRELRQRPCHDCGEAFKPHQMDFDHRDPIAKAFRLTSSRGMLAAQKDLTAELVKCDVVCANCHRIRTRDRAEGQPGAIDARPQSRDLARRRAYWQGRARLLDDLKSRACVDCAADLPSLRHGLRPCAARSEALHRQPDDRTCWHGHDHGRGCQVRYRMCELPSRSHVPSTRGGFTRAGVAQLVER